jgi:hypothetical protein
MENLDHDGFSLPDQKGFLLLLTVYNKACQDPFPLEAVCGKVWRNGEGQLSFLKHAVSAPPEIFTFSHSSRKQVRRIPALVVYVAFAAQWQMQWLQLKAHCRVYNNTNCLGYHLVCFSVNFFLFEDVCSS